MYNQEPNVMKTFSFILLTLGFIPAFAQQNNVPKPDKYPPPACLTAEQDHQGSYMAAVAAGPVFRLLSVKDLGVSDDYMTEKMPEVNRGLLEGNLAWRQHDGGHTDAPNIRYFIEWINKHISDF
jgi:hypothetical protein